MVTVDQELGNCTNKIVGVILCGTNRQLKLCLDSILITFAFFNLFLFNNKNNLLIFLLDRETE